MLVQPKIIPCREASMTNYALYKFESVNDLVDYAKEITNNFADEKCYEFHAKSTSWKGVDSIEKLKKWLEFGREESVNKLNKLVKINEQVFEQGKKLGYKSERSCQGFRPSVARSIIGLPNSMYRLKYTKTPNKIINFLVDTAASRRVSSSDYEEQFTKIFNYIYSLEKKGYRCKVTALTTFTSRYAPQTYGQVYQYVIKHEYEQFNLAKMGFALTSTAFFRAFMLLLLYFNCDLEDCKVEGAGIPLYHEQDYYPDYFAEVINLARQPNEKVVYVNYRTEIDELEKAIGKIN